MSILGSISNIGENIGSAIRGVIPTAKMTYGAQNTPQTTQEPPQVTYRVPGRDLTLSDTDLAVLRPVLYGELSNRNQTKKELEARVILNTALNRMKEYTAKGQTKTLSDVLSAPNQYQAYGGEQFNAYGNPPDELSKKKREQVDAIVQKFLNEMEGGEFPDVTEGAYYYKHHPSGIIEYDNKRPLFETPLGQK